VLTNEERAIRLIDSGVPIADALAYVGLPPLAAAEEFPVPETLAARHLGLADLGRTIEIAGDAFRYRDHPSAGTHAGVLVGYAPGEVVETKGPDPQIRAYRKLILRYGTVTERIVVDLNTKILALPRTSTR
jgi:hypothetical protein